MSISILENKPDRGCFCIISKKLYDPFGKLHKEIGIYADNSRDLTDLVYKGMKVRIVFHSSTLDSFLLYKGTILSITQNYISISGNNLFEDNYKIYYNKLYSISHNRRQYELP